MNVCIHNLLNILHMQTPPLCVIVLRIRLVFGERPLIKVTLLFYSQTGTDLIHIRIWKRKFMQPTEIQKSILHLTQNTCMYAPLLPFQCIKSLQTIPSFTDTFNDVIPRRLGIFCLFLCGGSEARATHIWTLRSFLLIEQCPGPPFRCDHAS